MVDASQLGKERSSAVPGSRGSCEHEARECYFNASSFKEHSPKKPWADVSSTGSIDIVWGRTQTKKLSMKEICTPYI